MKILYLSCHAILEYDELKMFEELGLDYFSLGSYIIPQKPVDPIRPALMKEVDQDLLKLACDRDKLTPEFVEHFDTIIVMHVPEWIENNWPVIRGKRVIWRTIGQSTPQIERRMKAYRDDGLEVVRYSKREQLLQDNVGCDAVIHFAKDPNEFTGYVGSEGKILTFAQDFAHRNEYCNYPFWRDVAFGLPARIYGPKNEEVGEYNGGFKTYDELKQLMRDFRCYLYTGTQPACYTLSFIEAMMTGIPMLCIGPKAWNSLNRFEGLYEVGDFIKNGSNGFISDNPNELRDFANQLLVDQELARKIGIRGRQSAIELFGIEAVKSEWLKFLSM